MKNTKLMVSAALVVGGILGNGVASAADMALKARPVVAPIYNWTGFYVGASVGGIWNDPDQTVDVTGPANGGPNSQNAQAAIARLSGDRFISWLAGVQAGYNWQMANKLVLGIEADISGTDLNSAQSVTNRAFPSTSTITTSETQHLNYFGTVRGRIGYAGVDNLLVYGTGGFAYGGGNATFGVASTTGFGGGARLPFSLIAQDSSVRVGWTVGAGAEVALASFGPNWSVKGEYLYYDIGRDHLVVSHSNVPPPGFTASTDPQFKGSLIRIGLNYKLSPAALVARY